MTMQPTAIIAAKGVFIGNRWSPAASGRTLETMAPAEGRAFAEIAAGDKPDIDRAVKAAQAALAGAWDDCPPPNGDGCSPSSASPCRITPRSSPGSRRATPASR